jgi:xanthosine utilization system XapX-like protein
VTPSRAQSTVPLTRAQRLELLESCIPLAIVTVLVGGYVVMALAGIIPHPPLLIYLVIAVVFALVGYQAAQVARDLSAGVALVEEDQLLSAWRASGPSNDVYGKFERLGTLSLKQATAAPPATDTRYLLTYSPASKTVWSMVPAE